MVASHDVAYHDYEGIATDLDERERLVTDLGSKSAMILRNHGTLALGGSVAACFLRLYFLERACEAQVRHARESEAAEQSQLDGGDSRNARLARSSPEARSD